MTLISDYQPKDLSEAEMMYPEKHNVNSNLDPELKAEWLAALRDPSNKQGLGKLHVLLRSGAEEFCCLGLLAKVCGLKKEVSYHSIYSTEYKYSFPSGETVERDDNLLGGLWSQTKGFAGKGGRFSIAFELFGSEFIQPENLSELNDNDFIFAQIADLVEYFF
jgi:hypothetical protein